MQLFKSRRFNSLIPHTAAEQAALSQRWQRRGLLGRLVRVADVPQPVRLAAPRRDERGA